ncbi:MAG: DUF4065 domain-containing protein [Paludibacteraceae bacterium]|nr:DUF4065 domain-containing protein [Paludibacteraceae bacterium]
MAYFVQDIANKLLHRAMQNDEGELLSNLKLQKLLYYEQGYHLAAFGTPLFDEDIEAWMYGPVVPSVYEHFKAFGNKGIEGDFPNIQLSEKEENLFEDVYDTYCELSAIGLMRQTHSETPWTSVQPGKGNIISKESMKEYFSQLYEQ